MGTAKRTPASRKRRQRNRAVAGDVGSSHQVERLRRDFAKFRRTHELRTRIPDRLRRGALAALQKGTTESEVRRACGVTSKQLAQWQKSQRGCEPQHSLENLEPRIFPVFDTAAGLSPAGDAEQQELELRLGSWSICVRQRYGLQGGR